jgi:hypothetical protein
MRQALASLERYYQTPGSGPSVTDGDGIAPYETALSSVPEGSLGTFKHGSEVVDEVRSVTSHIASQQLKS